MTHATIPASPYLLAGLAYGAGARLAAVLPADCARGVGRLAGLACWVLQPSRRERLRANYEGLHPHASRRRIATLVRRAYADFGASVVDTLRLATLPRERLGDEVRVLGLEHLRTGLAAGGAVLLVAHAGNWEWGGAALAAHGIPVAAVARGRSGPAGRFFTEARSRFGVRTAPAVRALAAECSGVLVVFCDRGTARDPRRDPQRIARRAIALAARRGWRALPAIVVRERGRYCVRVGAPLPETRGAEERATAARQALAHLAGELRRSPSQWFAFAPSPRTGALAWPR
jgi:KDO2-lipid IV(A) lauroyltransferase